MQKVCWEFDSNWRSIETLLNIPKMQITKIKTVHTVETDEDKIYKRFGADDWLSCCGWDWQPIDNLQFVEKLEALFQEEIGKCIF